MKQVQPQQPTNIAWCFPTSSAAPGQINQSRNSRAKEKGEGERMRGSGVCRRGVKERDRDEAEKKYARGVLEQTDTPIISGSSNYSKSQNCCVHSCKPGSGPWV